ncbi:RluA family pseudouridine synthase [Agaribacterium haliotis]|uniref:RluA family pseudouridine synthase n=1 Tax=Agaribacterium haliotis TaxID=2013869 RepID=UPI000BB565CE|nr:RluA family pseudouridine synthase [Agaribacterium haliotis]
MNTRVRMIEIDEGSDAQRLDNFLMKTLKGAPKSLVYRIIRKGEVRVNKGRAKPDTRLYIGDVVRVPPVKIDDSSVQHKPGAGLLQLLEHSTVYESNELLIVNKPSGLAVHGGSGVNLGLIEALRAQAPDGAYLELVHRLDRDTSGCIMIAKKRRMLKYLQDLLREAGSIQKTYWALVDGRWPRRLTMVDAALYKREARGGERYVEVNGREGKASKTRFQLLKHYREASLVEAKPLTGRTHQIRVHAKHAGHALVGDDKYGAESFNRLMRNKGFKRLFLHAKALSLPLPNGERLEVEAELPEELHKALLKLEPLS